MKYKKENEYLTKLYFEETVRINEDGRYEVSLPWKGDHLPLPSNKEIAIKRLETTTRKLHHENLFTAYDDVFTEWASLGIIGNDPVESSSRHHEHYLPHRPVVKQQGTTKVRPVFDASARQVGSPSLNQCLESGPNLLELIPSLLLRFREHKYGIVADIEKAFLQISVRPKDRNFLKFFWWNGKENVEPKIMRHGRVRTIDILLRSFYVDDLITSLDNEAEILPFIEESHHILAEGKFNLRGWKYTGDDPEQVTSVLELIWNRREDELKINLDWLETYELEIVSKRVILSVIHRIFDPVGFLCPVLLMTKLMLQKMWKDNIPWDREVEDNMKLEFLKWFEELSSLKNLSVRRCFYPASSGQHGISVHTFCDASQFAYAAAVFIRIECADVVQVNLLVAKSTVAPVKTITIPRLELLAATVGFSVKNFGLFLSITEFKRLTDPTLWKHLPGAQNPANLPSRGCSAHQLSCSRWLEGPKWLLQTQENWPVAKPVFDEQSVLKERRKTHPTSKSLPFVCSLNQTENNESSSKDKKEDSSSRYYYYFSSYDRLLRMAAWMKRFIFNCKNSTSRITGELSHQEIKQAELKIVKMIQDEYFIHEVNRKKLNSLTTYKDGEGILRVKTKITYRKDSEDFKNPIILPSHHQVVERLIMTEHKKNSHAGLQMLLNILREHYWILNARKTVRSVLSKCVICLRHAKRNVTTPLCITPRK
ncbi:hypothetical protein AVEN_111828-1 [Araneus ventricosus]|uniref:Integrase zinc-binding domain-containing protein n=1 Tax=Araneus ventricosus TaxID=182803 RepID=A0A4Y2JIE8_ARAVE|nr:hypothetical protein AVEN_111828-1 [Araneus ventricosus]